MLNLKILLQSKWFYIIILFIAVLKGIYIFKYNTFKSIYNGSDHYVVGYIYSLNVDGNHVKIKLKAKEKIIVNYYLKTEEQLKYIKDNYNIGDYIKVSGEWERPRSNSLFNLFNYQLFLLSEKTFWAIKVNTIEKINKAPPKLYLIKKGMIKQIEKADKTSSYIKNYIISENLEIDSNVLKSYQINGLNHLLALSGAQLSLFVVILMFFLNHVSQNKIRNYIVITIVILFYLFLTNFPPSLLRASLLFVFLKIKEVWQLNIKTIYCFIFVLSILLLYNPYYIYHIGFVFSFAISFYLIMFRDLINRFANYFSKTFLISLIAFLVSVPILINNFFEINLLVPLTNLIFVPLFLLVIFPFSLLTFFFPILDQGLFLIIKMAENISLFISQFDLFVITLKKIPWYIVIIYYLVITYILISFRNKKYINIIYIYILIAIHFYSPYLNKYPQLTFLDVGQGDCALIELPKNKGNVLIDTGGIINFNQSEWMNKKTTFSLAKNNIIPFLKSKGIRELDYLILTHGHYDHAGEAINMVEYFKVNRVIFNSGSHNELEKEIMEVLDIKGIPYLLYNQGKIKLDTYNFSFLNHKYPQDENEDSLILYTILNNYHILLLGDAGIKSEKFLLNTYIMEKMDILKIGHHGSLSATSEEFIKITNPTYAIISAGLNNRFNHPHPEVIKRLDNHNIKYYETAKNGSIQFIFKDKLIIKTCFSS